MAQFAAALGGANILGGALGSLAGITVGQTFQQMAQASTEQRYESYDIGQFSRQIKDIGGGLREFREQLQTVTKGMGVSFAENAQAMKTALKYGGEGGGSTAIRTSSQSSQDSLIFAITNGLNKQLVNSVKDAMGQGGILGGNKSYSMSSGEFERAFQKYSSLGAFGARSQDNLQNAAAFANQQAGRGVQGIDPTQFVKIQAQAAEAAKQPGQAYLQSYGQRAFMGMDQVMGNITANQTALFNAPQFLNNEAQRNRTEAIGLGKQITTLKTQQSSASTKAEEDRLQAKIDELTQAQVRSNTRADEMEQGSRTGPYGQANAIQGMGPQEQVRMLKDTLVQRYQYKADQSPDSVQNQQSLRIAQEMFQQNGVNLTQRQMSAMLKVDAQREAIENKEKFQQEFNQSDVGRELSGDLTFASQKQAGKMAQKKTNILATSAMAFGRAPDPVIFDVEISDDTRAALERQRKKEIIADKTKKGEKYNDSEVEKQAQIEIMQKTSGFTSKNIDAATKEVQGLIKNAIDSGEIQGQGISPQEKLRNSVINQNISHAGSKEELQKGIQNIIAQSQDTPESKVSSDVAQRRLREYENKNSSAYKTAEYEFQQKTGKTSSSSAKEFESFLLNKQKEESAQILMGKGINDVKFDASGNMVTDSSGAAVKEEKTWRNKKTGELVTETEGKKLGKFGEEVKGSTIKPANELEKGAVATAELNTSIKALTNVIQPFLTAITSGASEGAGGYGAAFGGQVFSGRNAIMVGERGPELFVPKSDGEIITNNQLTTEGRAFGGSVFKGKAYTIGERGPEAFAAKDISLDSFLKNLNEQKNSYFMSQDEKENLGITGPSFKSVTDLFVAKFRSFAIGKDGGEGGVNNLGGGGSWSGGSGAKTNLTGTFGEVAARFESGGRFGAVSTGAGDHGGVSYGVFQLSSKMGSVTSFLNATGFAKDFEGLTPGSPAFSARWQQMAQNDAFNKAQTEYGANAYLKPYQELLKKQGFDLTGRGRAVHEMMLSTSLQYGAAGTYPIVGALKGLDLSKMTDAQIIEAVQKFKHDNVATHFVSSSSDIQQGVANRTKRELDMLLQIEAEESASDSIVQKAVGGMVNRGQLTMVGERGPELIMPTSSSSIMSGTNTGRLLSDLSSAAGGGSSKNAEQKLVVQFVAPDGKEIQSKSFKFGEQDEFIKIPIGESWRY